MHCFQQIPAKGKIECELGFERANFLVKKVRFQTL